MRSGVGWMRQSPTLAEKMAQAANRPAGFDYIRLVLATSIILSHTFVVAYGNPLVMGWWGGWQRAVLGLLLPPFFALSGFLVAGSLERTKSLVTFLGLRVIRLIPALAVEITLSALILGPLLTTLPLRAYFSAPEFHNYFLNIAGNIHFILPGVFLNHPSPFVNQQLWTVPFEMECYFALGALALIGVASRRWLLLFIIVILQLVYFASELPHGLPPHTLLTGRVLVGCFLAGVVVFKFRDKIPSSATLATVCFTVMVVLLLIPGGDRLLPFPVAYVTTWLGIRNPKRDKIVLSGDYSYGLFLYGFPIQQLAESLGGWTHSWWMNFAIAYPLTFLFAAFSWWCIERPALGLKVFITHCEKHALRFPPLRWHSERVYTRGDSFKSAT
jgi:peptidoglycan/LPS O-acetylase OafA/YrhL